MKLLRFKDQLIWEKLMSMRKMFLTTEPGSIVKFLVLAACFTIVLVQLYECWNKLRNPPITTHTKLSLNESLSYPALTICREPPYNKRYYQNFNFTGLHVGPYPMTANWNDFPYDMYNISDFWDVAVYNKTVITCYGLSGIENSELDLESSIHYTTGMCHTIRPRKEVPSVTKRPGYHILLLHDLYNHDPMPDGEAGWYIYVHEVKERFSENINIYAGRQAMVFVPVGEEVKVSLDVYQFNSIQNCSNDGLYSLSECEENCWIKDDIYHKVNCSGPWFPSLNRTMCNEPNGMIDLVKATLEMNPVNCCPKSCHTVQYKTSIVKRTTYPTPRKLTSGVGIYFSSKAVVTVEERYSYDWNVFIADLGGSVGFLLGLSVIGIIAYLERTVQFVISFLKREKKG